MTIFVHTKHTQHQHGLETNKLFLPVHLIVMYVPLKNLRQMVSSSIVALASKNKETKIQKLVKGLELLSDFILFQKKWNSYYTP